MLFSVIIPVYNVEKYIDECLQSLLKQTFNDFEAILIDDGSSDGSGKICDYFANKDSKFKVLHNSNMGVSLARLEGLKIAKGEYICFVDSDDYVANNFLETFANIINEHHPDVVCCNWMEENKPHLNINFNDHLYNKDEIEKTIYPYVIHASDYSYFPPIMWAKAFKKELIVDNITKLKIKIGEDVASIPPIIIRAEKLYLCSEPLYFYRVSNNSAIKSKKPRDYQDVVNIHQHYVDNLKDRYDEFSIQIDRLIAHVAFNCSITQFYSDKKYKEVKDIILNNLSNPVIDASIKKMDSKGMRGKLMHFALKHRSVILMKLYSKIM